MVERREDIGLVPSEPCHEVAVEAFCAAEPIVAEVLRRVNGSLSHRDKSAPSTAPSNNKMKQKMGSSPTPISHSQATQTDASTSTDNTYTSLYRPPTPPPCIISYANDLFTPSSRQGVAFSGSADVGGLTDIEYGGDGPLMPYYEEDTYYYDDRQYDMEYEEVTLVRSDSREKVGLTLCYCASEDDLTDVFISEICPGSIAGMDGRIREGDQILQVNYHDVCSRDQAIDLFGRSRTQVTLLLARPSRIDDGFMEGRPLEELHVEMLDQHQNFIHCPQHLLQQQLEEGATAGAGQTDGSSKSQSSKSSESSERSEHELLEGDYSGHIYANISEPDPVYVNDSPIYAEPDMISQEDCEKFRQALAKRCPEEEARASLSKQSSHSSQSSIEKEIALLNKEMEHIQMECEEIVESHMRDRRTGLIRNDRTVVKSPRMVPRMGTRLEYLKGQVQGPMDNMVVSDQVVSNSDSKRCVETQCSESRAAPLTQALNEEENGNQQESIPGAEDQKPSECLSDGEKCTQTPVPSTSNTSNSKPARSSKRERRSREQAPIPVTGTGRQSADQYHDLYDKYANVMYTNKANLEHTIKVQQQLFHQQMMRRKSKDGAPKLPPRPSGSGSSNVNDNCETGAGATSGQTMEWVVKRRADGSRYITRRPVRNKLLKERARKVAEERCGMTTDDDAVSEMKTGRYWSKEDRKKHLEKARDHKRRKETMLRARMETLKEAKQQDDRAERSDSQPKSSSSREKESRQAGGAEGNTVDAPPPSQRKTVRSKSKQKVVDDFTTVQELLAHGNKSTRQEGKSSPLLSVTTV